MRSRRKTKTDLLTYVREAVEQARLAYKFTPSSYTFHALRTCLSALHYIEEQKKNASPQKDEASLKKTENDYVVPQRRRWAQ